MRRTSVGVLAVFALVITISYVYADCELTGVNLSGAEFSSGEIPGAEYHNYVWNTPKDAAYFVNKGMNFYRIPFLWERMQTIAAGDLEPSQLNPLITLVNNITGEGKYVMLDPHNYGSGFGGKVGQSATSIVLFADLWYKLALVFKNNSRVVFGLMNEPNNQDVHIWRNAAQGAINAIRYAGATNLITVPGIDWTGAYSWNSSGNADVMWDIQDPVSNYIYEVHQYLDIDSSGTHNTCVSATIGSERLHFFTQWARNISKKAIVGEFGVGKDQLCCEALADMLSYMDANSDVWLGWTYWSSGPWWGDWYFSNLTPNSSGVDRPQMPYIKPHIAKTSPTPVPLTPKGGSYTPPSSVMVTQTIYSNGKLANGYADYSWAAHDLCNKTAARPGDSCSISFNLTNYGALWFKCNECINLNESMWFSMSFWFNPGPSGSAGSFALFMMNKTSGAKVGPRDGIDISAYAIPPVLPNQWSQIFLPLGSFAKDQYSGFQFQGNHAGEEPQMYMSDISLVAYPDKPSAPVNSISIA